MREGEGTIKKIYNIIIPKISEFNDGSNFANLSIELYIMGPDQNHYPEKRCRISYTI